MLMTMLLIRDRIKQTFEKHYRLMRILLRFVFLIGTLSLVKYRFDYNTMIGNYGVVALISIVGAFLPEVFMTVMPLLFLCIELASASSVLSILVMLIMATYLLLFGRLERKQGYFVLLIPLLSTMSVGCIVPIVAALFLGPIMIPAIAMGTLLEFVLKGFVDYTNATSAVIDTNVVEQTMAGVKYVIDSVIKNQQFYIFLAAYCITFLCIYGIRRTKVKNASAIGILVGSLIYLSIVLISNIVFYMNLGLVSIVIPTVIAALIAWIASFFHISLDYQGTRKLQFEDDEYYYYVTAVPKYKVSSSDGAVKKIVQAKEEEEPTLHEELEKDLTE